MTDEEPGRAGNRRQWFLPTMKWIRVLVIVAAVAVLTVFLLKMGIDPVEAGKKSGH
jgi:hypothetical protein